MRLHEHTLVVTILHQAHWEQTPVAQSLAHAGADLALAVFGNGPADSVTLPAKSELALADGRNPGVGGRYVRAAHEAAERGDSYVLLLDQDFSAPREWWQAYQDAVDSTPLAHAWAPLLLHGGQILSPFSVRNGLPQRWSQEPSFPVNCRGTVALNSGLLVRTEVILGASRLLQEAPLDFSDYLLFFRVAQRDAQLGRVQLTLSHDSSTHRVASTRQRLDRFAWFCQGARTWAAQERTHRRNVRLWIWGRALKLAISHRNLEFLRIARAYFHGDKEVAA